MQNESACLPLPAPPPPPPPVEAAVCSSQDGQLQPVDLRLAAPTAEQFHCDLQQLIERGGCRAGGRGGGGGRKCAAAG